MMEFLVTWGPAVGIFVLVGALMQALNKTIGAKEGDHGFKGVWYVWKRVLVMPLGGGLGALLGVLDMTTPFGEGTGYGVLAGILAAAAAGQIYESVIGAFKAHVRHKLAKNGKKPDAK
jgi:hypothetical protein